VRHLFESDPVRAEGKLGHRGRDGGGDLLPHPAAEPAHDVEVVHEALAGGALGGDLGHQRRFALLIEEE